MVSSLTPGDVAVILTDPVFSDINGVPADPTTVTLVWRRRGQAETSWTYGIDAEIIRIGPGAYQANILLTLPGVYDFQWAGAGVVDAAAESTIVVESAIVPGDGIFINEANDYDSIRALLGVEVVDLEDNIIDLPAYRGAVEARVISAVPDYAILMALPAAAVFLKNGAYYGIAATLAESYVKGGTVSLVHEEQPRRNWSEWARIFWTRYEEFLSRARSEGTPNLEDDVIPMMMLSGPSRSAWLGPNWTEIYPPVWPTDAQRP